MSLFSLVPYAKMIMFILDLIPLESKLASLLGQACPGRSFMKPCLASVMLKPGFTVDINETGAFNDATAPSQLEYMKEFFSPRIYQNKEFAQLQGRIFYWLSGR